MKMKNWTSRALVAGIAVMSMAFAAIAAERFQKLSGSQIRAKFIGMEMTDEVHWGELYRPNGTLEVYGMGHKTVGKWRVQKDELCVERTKEDSGCYQVWLAGKKIELRREGSQLPLEGVLQRPAKRQ